MLPKSCLQTCLANEPLLRSSGRTCQELGSSLSWDLWTVVGVLCGGLNARLLAAKLRKSRGSGARPHDFIAKPSLPCLRPPIGQHRLEQMFVLVTRQPLRGVVIICVLRRFPLDHAEVAEAHSLHGPPR